MSVKKRFNVLIRRSNNLHTDPEYHLGTWTNSRVLECSFDFCSLLTYEERKKKYKMYYKIKTASSQHISKAYKVIMMNFNQQQKAYVSPVPYILNSPFSDSTNYVGIANAIPDMNTRSIVSSTTSSPYLYLNIGTQNNAPIYIDNMSEMNNVQFCLTSSCGAVAFDSQTAAYRYTSTVIMLTFEEI